MVQRKCVRARWNAGMSLANFTNLHITFRQSGRFRECCSAKGFAIFVAVFVPGSLANPSVYKYFKYFVFDPDSCASSTDAASFTRSSWSSTLLTVPRGSRYRNYSNSVDRPADWFVYIV